MRLSALLVIVMLAWTKVAPAETTKKPLITGSVAGVLDLTWGGSFGNPPHLLALATTEVAPFPVLHQAALQIDLNALNERISLTVVPWTGAMADKIGTVPGLQVACLTLKANLTTQWSAVATGGHCAGHRGYEPVNPSAMADRYHIMHALPTYGLPYWNTGAELSLSHAGGLTIAVGMTPSWGGTPSRDPEGLTYYAGIRHTTPNSYLSYMFSLRPEPGGGRFDGDVALALSAMGPWSLRLHWNAGGETGANARVWTCGVADVRTKTPKLANWQLAVSARADGCHEVRKPEIPALVVDGSRFAGTVTFSANPNNWPIHPFVEISAVQTRTPSEGYDPRTGWGGIAVAGLSLFAKN